VVKASIHGVTNKRQNTVFFHVTQNTTYRGGT
jgi:hypothetical protein